jgi:hypothetical protein
MLMIARIAMDEAGKFLADSLAESWTASDHVRVSSGTSEPALVIEFLAGPLSKNLCVDVTSTEPRVFTEY